MCRGGIFFVQTVPSEQHARRQDLHSPFVHDYVAAALGETDILVIRACMRRLARPGQPAHARVAVRSRLVT
jgi:hypothetical protein